MELKIQVQSDGWSLSSMAFCCISRAFLRGKWEILPRKGTLRQEMDLLICHYVAGSIKIIIELSFRGGAAHRCHCREGLGVRIEELLEGTPNHDQQRGGAVVSLSFPFHFPSFPLIIISPSFSLMFEPSFSLVDWVIKNQPILVQNK